MGHANGHTAQLCPYMGILCPEPRCKILMYPIIATNDDGTREDFLLKCPNENCSGKLQIYENKWIAGDEEKAQTETFKEFLARIKAGNN